MRKTIAEWRTLFESYTEADLSDLIKAIDILSKPVFADVWSEYKEFGLGVLRGLAKDILVMRAIKV